MRAVMHNTVISRSKNYVKSDFSIKGHIVHTSR